MFVKRLSRTEAVIDEDGEEEPTSPKKPRLSLEDVREIGKKKREEKQAEKEEKKSKVVENLAKAPKRA